MRTCILLTLLNLSCLMHAFACNSSNKETDKNSAADMTITDSTPKASRDSVAKGTTVTPSPSAVPEAY